MTLINIKKHMVITFLAICPALLPNDIHESMSDYNLQLTAEFMTEKIIHVIATNAAKALTVISGGQ